MKRCSKCKEEKDFSEFFKDKYTYSGYKSSCKSCEKVKWSINNKNTSILKEKILREEAEKGYKEILSKDTTDEIWKDIPNYEGKYQASNLGRIRCMPVVYRTPKGKLESTKHYIVEETLLKTGYKRASLTNKVGEVSHKGVHRWVMFAFHGEREESIHVNHINGVKNDNKLENLEYMTARENNHYIKTLNPDKYTSEYSGVYSCNRVRGGKKYESSIVLDGKSYYLGSSDSSYELYLKFQEALKNWEEKGEVPKPLMESIKTAKALGVGFHKLSGRFRVRYKKEYIGIFDTEELAERIYFLVEYLVERRKVELNKELISKIKKKYTTDRRLVQ